MGISANQVTDLSSRMNSLLGGPAGTVVMFDDPVTIGGWISESTTTFTDVNVSAYVPAGTKAVLLRVYVGSSTGTQLRVRKKGSAVDTSTLDVAVGTSTGFPADCTVPVDSSRIFQAKYTSSFTLGTNFATIHGYIIGATENSPGNYVALATPSAFSGLISASTTAFADQDVSALVPSTAFAVRMRSYLDASATNTILRVRKKGDTTDDASLNVHDEIAGDSAGTAREWTAPINEAKVFEAKFTASWTATTRQAWVVGYFVRSKFINDGFSEYTSAASPVTLTLDEYYLLIDTTAADVELLLPPVAQSDRKVYVVKIIAGANDAILNPNASENIEGGTTSYSFTGSLETRTFVCKGSGTNQGWWLVGKGN